MEIEVRRAPSIKGATIGELYIDGVFECYTLEDVVREPSTGRPSVWDQLVAWVKSWKVPKQTAIPSGRYRVVVNFSEHFQKELPELLNVPGFDGVRIHSGNGPADTEGCILVGQTKEANLIYKSRDAFKALYPKIVAALAHGGQVNVTLTNGQVIG